MNHAQKIAVAVTMLAVAVFLFLQARNGVVSNWAVDRGSTLLPYEVAITCFNVAVIALVGGAVTVLLGIKRKRPGAGE